MESESVKTEDAESPSDWVSELGYRPLERPMQGRMLAGVAAGIAEHFGIDVTFVRIAFVVLTVAFGIGVPLYLAGWLLMPDAACGWSIADDVLHHVSAH